MSDTEYNPINDMKQYFEGIIEGIDDNYLGKYYRKEHIKGGYIKKYKFKDRYTIFDNTSIFSKHYILFLHW